MNQVRLRVQGLPASGIVELRTGDELRRPVLRVTVPEGQQAVIDDLRPGYYHVGFRRTGSSAPEKEQRVYITANSVVAVGSSNDYRTAHQKAVLAKRRSF